MPVASILSISEEELEYRWLTEEGKRCHVSSVRWSDVSSVDVFKRDLFSYDLICLQLSVKDVVVEFDEEDPSWKELMAALPLRLPGFKAWGDWFSEVAFPAFEEKLQRVFERKNA